MATEPENGMNLFLSWGTVEWVLASIWSAGVGIAAWVWRLGSRTGHLEEVIETLRKRVEDMDKDIELNRRVTQQIGSALDKKIEDKANEQNEQNQILRDKLDSVREELPSRGFIEGQLNQQTARIDSLMNQKLRG